MEIKHIEFGQAIRFMKIAPSTGRSIYGKKLVTAFEEKYGFLEGPRLASDFDTGKGITFLHGFFDNTTVIEKVVIYNEGMIVDAKADTDLCDRFIDDAVKWVSQNANIEFGLSNDYPRVYQSHLIVEDNSGISKLFNSLSSIGVELSKILESYGDLNREIELISFAMQSDVAEKVGPVPFKFERRAGVPFSSNLYYSSAPVRTSDHRVLLQKLGSIVRG